MHFYTRSNVYSRCTIRIEAKGTGFEDFARLALHDSAATRFKGSLPRLPPGLDDMRTVVELGHEFADVGLAGLKGVATRVENT